MTAARSLWPSLCLFVGLLAACAELPPAPGDGGAWREARLVFDVAASEAAPVGVTLTVALPRSRPGRQTVRDFVFSHPPRRTFAADGVQYGEWRLVAPVRLEIACACRVWPFRWDVAAANAAGAALPPPAPAWTAPEKHLESDAPAVRRLAATVPEGEPLAVARGLYRATLDALDYQGFVPGADGAAAALARGHGDCTDFADLFVALCRARGIPARHVSGYLFAWKATPLHSWAEFWTAAGGWAPVDPLQGKLGKTTFGELPADRLAASAVRNDPRFAGGMLYRWTAEGDVTVRVTVMAE